MKTKNEDFVKIDIPELKKYGVKPFEIMKRKMRDENGKVWSDLTFEDAKKEASSLGYRLWDIREMLALSECYKKTKKVSIHDKEFMGIEELSFEENVCYEWIDVFANAAFRGGTWDFVACAGVFNLNLNNAPGNSSTPAGFRCCKDVNDEIR